MHEDELSNYAERRANARRARGGASAPFSQLRDLVVVVFVSVFLVVVVVVISVLRAKGDLVRKLRDFEFGICFRRGRRRTFAVGGVF